MNKNILVVEDDKRTNEIICDYLEIEKYNIFKAYDGVVALRIFNEQHIDVVILDIMMPHVDGFTVCKEIRNKSNAIIIIISAKVDESDSLKGFNLGADEYITKPFSLKILLAKVNALLKRSDIYNNNSKIISREKLLIDKTKYLVKVDEQNLELTTKEYELLIKLVENEGQVFSRSNLIDKIWGYDYQGDNRVVDTNIKTLRKKLGDISVYVHTVIGVGYKFEVRK